MFLWNSLLMRIELRLCACRNTRTHTKCEKGRCFAHKVVECLHTLYRNGVQNKSIFYCTFLLQMHMVYQLVCEYEDWTV